MRSLIVRRAAPKGFVRAFFQTRFVDAVAQFAALGRLHGHIRPADQLVQGQTGFVATHDADAGGNEPQGL